MRGLRRSAWIGALGTGAGGHAPGFPMKPSGKETKTSDNPDDQRPKLTLRAQPTVAIAPARVVLSADLSGGANDYEDFYCPTVAWDWGDGTASESTSDCQPYVPGKTEIKRRFTVEHVFRAGGHHVTFRLKRNDKVVASASVSIQVQAGGPGSH